jgi:hypothetical protein
MFTPWCTLLFLQGRFLIIRRLHMFIAQTVWWRGPYEHDLVSEHGTQCRRVQLLRVGLHMDIWADTRTPAANLFMTGGSRRSWRLSEVVENSVLHQQLAET